MEPKYPLTQERLKTLLSYNPETGVFSWRKRAKGITHSGRPAGCVSSAGRSKFYIKIRIDRVLYFAHRLAWFWEHGEMPVGIDHLDGDSLNNRLANLRIATQAENMANLPMRSDNTSKFKGVVKNPRCVSWIAQAAVGGVTTYLGSYPTAHQAALRYDEFVSIHRGAFATTNKSLGLL